MYYCFLSFWTNLERFLMIPRLDRRLLHSIFRQLITVLVFFQQIGTRPPQKDLVPGSWWFALRRPYRGGKSYQNPPEWTVRYIWGGIFGESFLSNKKFSKFCFPGVSLALFVLLFGSLQPRVSFDSHSGWTIIRQVEHLRQTFENLIRLKQTRHVSTVTQR